MCLGFQGELNQGRHMHVFTLNPMHVYLCMWTCVCIHAGMDVYVGVCIYTYTHARIYTEVRVPTKNVIPGILPMHFYQVPKVQSTYAIIKFLLVFSCEWVDFQIRVMVLKKTLVLMTYSMGCDESKVKMAFFELLKLNLPYHCPLQVTSGVLQAMELDQIQI